MIIIFYANGYMKMYLKENRYSVELKNNSTLSDFFDEIDSTMGQTLSKVVWDHEKRRFRGPVKIKIEGKEVKTENYRLTDGQTIEISRLLIGG